MKVIFLQKNFTYWALEVFNHNNIFRIFVSHGYFFCLSQTLDFRADHSTSDRVLGPDGLTAVVSATTGAKGSHSSDGRCTRAWLPGREGPHM